MKLIYSGIALAIVITIGNCQDKQLEPNFEPNKYINKQLFSLIKSNTKTWTAFTPENHPFKGLTEKQIESKMGLRMNSRPQDQIIPNFYNDVNSVLRNFGFDLRDIDLRDIANALGSYLPENPFNPKKGTIPASFDSRTNPAWSGCIHGVRDQMNCGSCWAFSSAAFLEDRFCIASNKAINVRLSPQDMVSCDYNNFGCNGGYLAPSLTYLLSEGLVSENCLPYQNKGSLCAYKCDSSSEQYRKYACQTGSMKILTITEQIQQEIMTNGPMMVGFTVYNDFLSYSNGIYEPTTSDVAGGHAVKIIGWDRDGSNKLFWICQNQWGTGWGMSGYFNIYAGKSGLDSAAFACSPDI